MENIVRLVSLKITNMKNVKEGQIIMPHAHRKQLSEKSAEILGIYGQNGSGKTAVVDTLFYLQKIMIGDSLDKDLIDYIDINSKQAEITADFYIHALNLFYEVSYKLLLRVCEGRVQITRETLSAAKSDGECRTNKTVFMDYQRDDRESIFLPKNRLEELMESNKENRTNLIVARKIAEKTDCSYIFGESSREIFFEKHNNNFRYYAEVIQSLFKFALKDLFVIRNTHSGVITANFVLPMAFRVEQNKIGFKGDFTLSLTEPAVLNTEKKELLDTIIAQINTVLYTIIPGMKIIVKDYGAQTMDSGEEGHKIELMSAREGTLPIPIRMESEGIIKIISILNALIQAFGNASICLVIDELDAGIFEYMLGELLDVFQKSAKGQLIFTSHNLRPLEMLDKDSIMFSTANPKKRYIHMKNIKATNNLRDVYLRGITLGGQDEVIYEETDSLRIARAFRKAGRSIKYE